MKNFKKLYLILVFFSFLFLCNPIKSQINTSLPVGTTNGQGSVSPSGAFTYEVPLFIPEGTGGLVPQISLIYSSQSGDGVMGYGWNISGLSAISRVPKTIYHDGLTDRVKFVDSDALSLDGSRLICISGTHGLGGAKYRTEMETFVDIIQNGSGTTSSFLVKTKDGYELHFGISNNSRLKGVGSSAIMSWMLEKIVDLWGNQIQFYYNNQAGDVTLDRIEYSGNTIRLTYENRPDPSNYYIEGFVFKQTKRITSFKMESDGSTIREYLFNYEAGSPTLLSTITEYGRNGQSLNPLVFSWGTLSELIEEHSANLFPSDKGAQFYYGDFNGDGRMDIVVTTCPNTLGAIWERWDLYLANSSGTGFTKRSGGTLSSSFKGFYVADVNNDGKMDLLLRTRITTYHCCQYCDPDDPNLPPAEQAQGLEGVAIDYEYNIFSDESFLADSIEELRKTNIFTDSTVQFTTTECCLTWCSYTTESFLYYTFNGTTLVRGEEHYDLHFNGTPPDVTMYAGLDFNGDGRTDYLLLDKDKNMFRVLGVISPSLPSFNKPDKVEFLDFNGDGRTDIMVIKNDNTKIFSLNSTTSQWDVIYNAGFPTKWHRVILGDFNGDGKTDILTWVASPTNKWYLNFSTGTGYTWPHIEGLPFHNVDPNPYSSDNIVFTKDFNGDGKDDILQVRHNWNGGLASTSTYNFYQSNGDGTFSHESIIGGLGFYSTCYNFADYNGDGIIDISQSGGFGNIRIMLIRKDQNRTLLQSAMDGLGRSLSVEYKSLPKAGSQYVSGSGSVFPLMDYNGTFFVATKTQFSYPGLPTTTNVFNYTGAIIHMQGKGFMGFRKFKKTNQTTGDWTEMEFEVMPNFYFPMLKKTISGIGAQQTAIETNSNAIVNLGNKRFFPYVQSIVSQDLLRSVTVNTDFEFDSFGNITRQYTIFGNQATEEVVNTYVAAGSWCPSKVQSSSITKRRISPANTQTQSFSYTYNSNGLLSSESGMGLNKSYVYNSNGNMTSVTLTGNGVNGPRTTLYEYDSKGRVTKITSPGNLVTKYTRFAYTGLIQKEELPNDSWINYSYDGFGRVTSRTTQVGGPAAINHTWANGEHGALTKISTTPTGLPTTTVWFDAYDREIRREEPGFSSSMVTTFTFNTKGKLTSVTNPDNTTVTYTYDNLGRLITENYIDLNKTYAYSGTTVTVTSPRDVSTTKYDALGNVLESTVNGQKVTYTYNALSQPLSITPQWGASVTMEYDAYGFQSKITDPSAGTIEYTYNALGELLSQKNNRNQTCIISYDNIGRVIEKSWAGFSFTYEYYADGGGKGLVKKATLGDISEEYFYDSYGRMNKVQMEGASDEVLSFQYTFNWFGGVTSITYPNGFVINRTYQNGFLKDIKTNAGTTIWRLETVNAAGQITKSFINNSMYHERTYDIYGFPTSIKTTRNTNVVQHFTYSFDTNKGNMTQRKDEKYNLTENFSYDNLHRLTSTTQLPWATTLQNQYEANGNIAQKTNVGNFVYNLTPNVYAITGLTGAYANTSPPSQSVSYTPFEKPSALRNEEWYAEFTYGPDQQRRLMNLFEDVNLRETWLYFGSYEEKKLPNGNVYKYCYVDSPEGTIALYRSLNGGGATKYNILKDHLGSVTALVNTSGSIVEEYSYDAWGRRRNPADYRDYNIDDSQFITKRGYTFHEHLGKLDVINMNARIYDPILGRFLSPDNLVSSPGLAQNYNRYSYALNNPLIYTDPDGESAMLVVGMVMWFMSRPVMDYAKNNQNQNLYTLGALMNIGGSFMVGNFLGGLPGFQGILANTVFGGINSSMSGNGFVRGAIIGGGLTALPQFLSWTGNELGNISLGNHQPFMIRGEFGRVIPGGTGTLSDLWHNFTYPIRGLTSSISSGFNTLSTIRGGVGGMASVDWSSLQGVGGGHQVDLLTSSQPVTDILMAWKYRTKQSDIKLFDIVKPYPLNDHHMGKSYQKTTTIGGYTVELYLPDYRDVNHKAKAGFPIKWASWGVNPKNKTLAGFYLITPDNEIAIGISVRTKKAYNFLKLYYDEL